MTLFWRRWKWPCRDCEISKNSKALELVSWICADSSHSTQRRSQITVGTSRASMQGLGVLATLTSYTALWNNITSCKNSPTYAAAEKHLGSVSWDDLWQHWSRVSKRQCTKWRRYDLSSWPARVCSNSCIERVSTALSKPISEDFVVLFLVLLWDFHVFYIARWKLNIHLCFDSFLAIRKSGK